MRYKQYENDTIREMKRYKTINLMIIMTTLWPKLHVKVDKFKVFYLR